jgi:hypothetical protein
MRCKNGKAHATERTTPHIVPFEKLVCLNGCITAMYLSNVSAHIFVVEAIRKMFQKNSKIAQIVGLFFM